MKITDDEETPELEPIAIEGEPVAIEEPKEEASEPYHGKPVETWALEKGFSTPANNWKFQGAMASRGWVTGQFVTEEEFDKAVEESATHIIR